MGQRRSGFTRAAFRRVGAAPSSGGITQLTGPVTAGPGSGVQGTTVTPGAITNAMLAQVPTATWKGRHTAAVGDVEDGTMAQLAALVAPSLVLTAADMTALAALSVTGMTSGQEIYVVSTGWRYTLRATIGTADARYIVATFNDGARQWMKSDLLTANQTFVSPEIELASAPTDYASGVPIMPGYYFFPNAINRYAIVSAAGVQTVQAVFSTGNNAAKDNTGAPQGGVNNANFATAVVGPLPAWVSVAAPTNFFTVTSAGVVSLATQIVVHVTTAGAGTGGYSHKIRYFHAGFIVPTSFAP